MDSTEPGNIDELLSALSTALDEVERRSPFAEAALAALRQGRPMSIIEPTFGTTEGRALFERLLGIVRSPPFLRAVDVQVADMLEVIGSLTGLATVEIGYPDVTFRHPASGHVGPLEPSYGISMFCHHSEVPLANGTWPLDQVEVQVGERWVPWLAWCKEASAQGLVVICGRCRRDTLFRHERRCGLP